MSFRATGRHNDMTAPELTTETAFGALTQRHRRELQVHCYRMLGSLDDAEDLAQETFLRAWRFRETYAGRASLRAWLYRIATNACLDALERRPRAPAGNGEIAWLQPIPDELLERRVRRGRARRGGRRARDDRARVPGRAPAPPAAPARGADHARRARLAGARHRRAARDQRGVGQLRAAARAGGPEGAPAGAAQRVERGRERERPRAGREVHGGVRERRRRRR